MEQLFERMAEDLGGRRIGVKDGAGESDDENAVRSVLDQEPEARLADAGDLRMIGGVQDLDRTLLHLS